MVLHHEAPIPSPQSWLHRSNVVRDWSSQVKGIEVQPLKKINVVTSNTTPATKKMSLYCFSFMIWPPLFF